MTSRIARYSPRAVDGSRRRSQHAAYHDTQRTVRIYGVPSHAGRGLRRPDSFSDHHMSDLT